VAFHLHSFGLHSTGLASVLGIPARYATDYLQGRVDLTEQQAIQFARLLQVTPAELIRPLTPEEAAEWRFYRISASHHVAVWQRTRFAWQSHGLSMNQAASSMGFTAPHVCLALKPEGRRRILPLPSAVKLATSCDLPAGAKTFIADLTDPNPNNLQR
jgi:antitoxin component HigA of HigAB toxin-antitoxin module